jgi:predicted ATPase/class 3 adenylate cyclase/Tfp pilus assembly protein PilF
MNLPSGTVTFLFTDIEGSTKLWEEHPDAMRSIIARHDALLTHAIVSNNGVVFKTLGDAFYAAFSTAPDALHAARDAQYALHAEPWQNGLVLRVRMALHTGEAEMRDGDYFGQSLNRVARLLAVGHGGQILLSQTTHDALPSDTPLADKGSHRLKDLLQPEHIYQLIDSNLPSDFPPLRSLHNTNLPIQSTSFIGREREIQEVKHLLSTSRLLTLTGTGGCGKTRLALQAAADAVEEFSDGVWLVELAALSDPALVIPTVAHALGIRDEAGRSLTETLIKYLQSKVMLLILDNCEHLIEACAKLVTDLLRSCPQVKIVVTSREPLNVPGEHPWRVPSLFTPDPDTLPGKESDLSALLMEYDAPRLFVERATVHRRDFLLTRSNVPAVARLCHQLDGIPLAIELAAARVRSLSVDEINSRLDHRFRLLTGGSRTALPRQQTLRALIDWSYDLLHSQEQTLLQCLSVFAGGWTLVAAEQICSGEEIEDWEVLDLLTSLNDKSMVVAEPRDGATRYRLLETVRQYARERLSERGEEERCRDRHLSYFTALGEEAEPHLIGEAQQEWLERLEGEHDNLQAALQWAEDHAPERGLRLADAIWRFWYVRGHFAEGREHLEKLLQATEPYGRTSSRADALTAAGVMAYCQGEYAVSRAFFEDGLAIRRELHDRTGIAALLNNLGNVAYDQADYSTAQSLFEESLTLRRELGERRGIAATLNNLGNVANEQGSYSSARTLFEESLTIKRELGDRWGMANSLSNLGLVAYHQGDYAAAGAYFEESLTLRREVGDRGGIAISLNNLGNVALVQNENATARTFFLESLAIKHELGDQWGIAFSLENLAAAEASLGQVLLAAQLWGAAERLREEIKAPIPLNDRSRYERQVAEARFAANETAAFNAAWQAGRGDILESIIRLALAGMDESATRQPMGRGE